jgi:glycosyltransferase involved in cell wall biosynthesis
VKLNWFSPLPPRSSGIADYTLGLLPALADRVEVRLWTDEPGWNPSVERYAEVRQYRADDVPWREVNAADASIYHLGNHPGFHRPIWSVSRRCPGVVVLHDLRFHHFFAGLHREAGDRDGYLRLMRAHYGTAGAEDARAGWDGWLSIEYLAARYPLTSSAAEGALAVLVHNAGSVEALAPQLSCPVSYAPLPYAASETRLDDRSTSASLDGPPFRLVVLGHLGRNRRLHALIDALAAFNGRASFRLDLYGPIEEASEFARYVEERGLKGGVRSHGFVPDAELDAALASAHLAVNLRYPTMGEASFSQLRLWSHGLPTLVSRTDWYATLPSDAVAFVRPEAEIPDIQRHLADFLADPGRFREMGRRGQRWLRDHHAPEAYAAALVALAGEADRLRPRAAATRLLTRIRSTTEALVRQEMGARAGTGLTSTDSCLAEFARAARRELETPRREAARLAWLLEKAGRVAAGLEPAADERRPS